MKNSAAIAIALVASTVTAAVTWQVAQDEPGKTAEVPSANRNASSDGSGSAVPASAGSVDRESGTPWAGRDTTVAVEEREGEREAPLPPTPDGLNEEEWQAALNRADGISEWVQRSRDEGRLERDIERRVDRDHSRISQQIGLSGDNSDVVSALLNDRQDKFYEKPRAMFDAMMNDKEGFAEMIAIRRKMRNDEELSPQLEARKEALKQQMFGNIEGGATISDNDFGELFHRNRPDDWYEDTSFVTQAAAELGGADGEALVGYAEKMTYLDREYGANRRLYSIERELPITPNQREQLMQLYIQTRNPSDQQLGRILPPDLVEQARSAARGR